MSLDNPQLVALLQLSDSLFPIGGFAHSDGLESAAACAAVRDGSDLRQWLDAQLAGPLSSADGRGVALAMSLWGEQRSAELHVLDDELFALRASSASRQAVRAMGTRLLKTWIAVRPHPHVDMFLAGRAARGVTLPVAFGIACSTVGVAAAAAVESFLYTRLAGSVSAAMRLIPLGQTDAHRLLAEVLVAVPPAASRIVASNAPPALFAPALDIAAMTHQYQHSKLFRS
jgi:urease accessory protein